MAKWSFVDEGFTPVAVADATNFTNLGYMALQGGSSTQSIDIEEIYVAGLATSAAATPLVLGRDSTVGATLTALSTGESNAAWDPATAALAAPQQAFTQSTTKPQRSSTLKIMSCGLNAFGGVFHWYCGDSGDLSILGNTASLGEISLSCFTGGTPGLVSATIVYEPK